LSHEILLEKQLIREKVRALRESLAPAEVREAGDAVVSILRSHVLSIKAEIVCIYASTAKEVPTDALIKSLLEDHVVVGVPDWEAWKQGSGLQITPVQSGDDLVREGRVVPQPLPTGNRSPSVGDYELFILPGLAFDLSGNRLGMGGGYFDRLLSHASSDAEFIGLAYDFQIVTHLPTDIHDIPVHDVVTPGGLGVRGVKHKQEGKVYGS